MDEDVACKNESETPPQSNVAQQNGKATQVAVLVIANEKETRCKR